jgi:hypothetical protein
MRAATPPDPAPTAASEWPAAHAAALTEARESRLGLADRTLTDFAQRFPDSPEAAEVPYWRAVLPPDWTNAQVHLYAKTREWCGGFALWALKQAGLARDIFWQDGLGFLGKLPRTLTPSRGDIGYKQTPFQHHLLFDYEHDGWIMSVDGNQPDVREQRRRRDRSGG